MAEKQILINDKASVAYLEASQAVVKTGIPSVPQVSETKENAQTDGEIVLWGADNLFPQLVLKECRKNTIVGPTLDKKARIAYESGIEYGKIEIAGNEKKYIPSFDANVEAFLSRSKIHRYLISALRNFYWFYNVFPELILTRDRKEIHSIRCNKSAYCRYGKPKKGVVDKLYISPNWEEAPSLDSDEVVKVDVMDIYMSPEQLKTEGKAFKYIYPISYPTENEDFYSLADWNALRVSGWLDVAYSIPQFKKALFSNQITMKYLIEVSSHWWTWRYPGFDDFDTDKRRQVMKNELERFEKFMKGSEKTGSSLMVTFFSDPRIAKEFPGWKVTPIDNKIKDGIYVEDSNEASSHLLFALDVDPSIIGAQPGSKLGSGSGSDKRVAFNIYSDLVRIHQDLILEPVRYALEYNGYEVDYVKFKDLTSKENPPSTSPMNENPVSEPNQQAS